MSDFDSWWNASKYCQVVVMKPGARRIALDAWNAALQSRPHPAPVGDDRLKTLLTRTVSALNFIVKECGGSRAKAAKSLLADIRMALATKDTP